MRTVRLETKVPGNFIKVMELFDRDLFEALKPIGIPLEIVEFTGSKKGDRVHLSFGTPVNQEWISDIVEDGQTDTECYFVDVGVKLPWPLKKWRHKHIVRKVTESTSLIIDEMSFEGPNAIFSLGLKPFLYLSFLPRKGQYKRYFERVFPN